MKRYLLLFVLLLFTAMIFANPVNLSKAEKIAKNWISNSGKPVFIANTKPIVKNNRTLWYLINLQPRGFILVSADDAAYPVLGYSYEHNFDYPIQSPEVKDWISNYERQLNYIIENRLDNRSTIKFWDSILQNDFSFNSSERDVSPLTQTLWNQGQYYNEQCPYDENSTAGNNHVWAGCVATAMAQVMRFWSYPPQGVGSHSYNENDYGTQSANFGATTYHWNNMPLSPNSVINDVTTLLYHCGVSVDMDYGYDGSGAYLSDAVNALKNYFDYNSDAQMVWKSDYSDSGWENLLKTDLDNGRPILYRGQGSGGHAFVCDGYEGTNHFHFNWGWSGSANGYYYLDNLNPNGYNFTNYQGAGVHIHPNADMNFPPPTNLTASLTSNAVSLTWDPPATSEIPTYNVYKDGSLLANTSNQYYTDSAVSAGHRYSYYVTAVYTSPDGESVASNTVTATFPLDLPYSTDFSSTDGWWQTTDNCTDRWQSSDSNNAGGSSPEMKCSWEETNPATTRLVSPPLNTQNIDQLNLSFKHFYDYWDNSDITVKIQSSSDGETWTDESWIHSNPTSDIGPETVNTTISNNLGNTTYIAWVITGNLYNFDYWYVDDISITVPPPEFNLSPSSLSFGSVELNSSSTLQFTISNTGHSALTGNITTPTDFSVATASKNGSLVRKINRNTLSYTVAAGSSQDFNLTFSPTSQTSYSDNVQITSNDTSNPINYLSVSGTGIAADIDYSPNSFSLTMDQNKTQSKNLSISNNGNATLTYTISAHLPATRFSATVYPQSSNDWTGTTNGSTKTQHSLVKGYDNQDGWMKFDISSLPDNAIIDSVVFHGYVNSTSWPYWSITPLSNDPVTASASELKNDITAEENNGYYLYQNEGQNYSTGWKTYTLGGNISQDLENALSQDWFAIGIASRDNSTDYYIVFDGWNESNPPYLEIYYSIEVPWIKINNQYSYDSSVSIGNSENLSIQFDTSGMDLGNYSANLIITSNDPDENPVTIPVSLSVQHLAIIDLSPVSIDYGDVYVGSPVTQQFSIHNEGSLALQGYIKTIEGYEVSVSSKSDSLQFSVSAGNTKTFNLTCNPVSSGLYNGNILIHSNDNDNPDTYLSVTANALYQPIISVNKDSLNFGNVVVGQFTSQNFTITNNGDQVLTGSILPPTDFYVYNATSREFKPSLIVRDTLGFTVYPHNSKDYIVYFYPLSSGYKSGNITFQSNDAYNNNPQILVSGTGYFLPPENVTISISNGNVILDWDYNNNVSTYHIYSSDKPDSGFTELGTIPQPPFTIINGINSPKKFYRVTAE